MYQEYIVETSVAFYSQNSLFFIGWKKMLVVMMVMVVVREKEMKNGRRTF